MKPMIFLSCGQSDSWPGERKTAEKIQEVLEKDDKYDVFVATTKKTIIDLNQEILSGLNNSDYYIFVNFKREIIYRKKWFPGICHPHEYRGSLYTNQELGMAFAAGFDKSNMLLFNQSGAERAGLLGTMISNLRDFKNQEDVIASVADAVEETWKPDYSRKLYVCNAEIDPTKVTYEGRDENIAHVTIQDRRQNIVALNAVAHLFSICDDSGKPLSLHDKFPLKCTGFGSYSHVIWPSTPVKFDLFGIDLKTNHVYMHTQDDVRDKKSGSRRPIIDSNGTYFLEYEIYAEHFPIAKFIIRLTLGPAKNVVSVG